MYELEDTIQNLMGSRGHGSGVNRSYLCPFHEERSPSFSIHMDEGLWYCFGCGRKGNLDQLAKSLGTELTDEQRQDLLIRSVFREPEERKNFAALANLYRRSLTEPAGRREWSAFVRSRGLQLDAADHFGVGYASEKGALAFPYWMDDGTVPAIKYRHHDGSKSAETGSKRVIYNVNDIIGAGTVVICEGESDTIALWSHATTGITVCGCPGAGVSERTWANWALDFIFARRIYIAFDADEAGDKGAETAMRVLGTERCTRIRPTKGKDIAEHLMKGGTLDELGLAAHDIQLRSAEEVG